MSESPIQVAMVILHREDRVLMQLRGDEPGIYAGGMWGIFGGHMEPGEMPEETARREIEEELGLALDGPLSLFARRIDEGRERFVFAAPLGVELEDLSLREGDGLALMSKAQLEVHAVVPVHREILSEFFGR